MCKRDTESVKVASESVLSNMGESRRYALDQVFAGGLSPYTVFPILAGQQLHIKSLTL